jgi:endonuclease YncB( thermonuclease family)
MRRSLVGGGLALLAVVGLAGALPTAAPAEVAARPLTVIAVRDGDTLTVRTPAGASERVRLTEIDAPESAQPYGGQSRRKLRQLVAAGPVRLERAGSDRYGRTLARVYAGGHDVNKAMVRSGAAWVYDAYSTDPAFEPLEAAARAERAGLWSQPATEVVAPWLWRKGAHATPRPARRYARLRYQTPVQSNDQLRRRSGLRRPVRPIRPRRRPRRRPLRARLRLIR